MSRGSVCSSPSGGTPRAHCLLHLSTFPAFFRYEDEIKRLRQVLDTRGGAEGAVGPPASGGPAPPHLPSSTSQGPPPIASGGSSAPFQDSYNRNGSSSSNYDREGRPIPASAGGEKDRADRERLNSSQGNANGNGNGDAGSNKRMRLEGSGAYAPGSPGGPKKEERERYGESVEESNLPLGAKRFDYWTSLFFLYQIRLMGLHPSLPPPLTRQEKGNASVSVRLLLLQAERHLKLLLQDQQLRVTLA